MKLVDVKQILNAEVLCGEQLLDREVDSCFACDLISEMLLHLSPRTLVVTSLVSPHILHTAHVMDASGIVIVGSKRPDEAVIMNGNVNNVPLLATSHFIFECCGLLFARGLKGLGSDCRNG